MSEIRRRSGALIIRDGKILLAKLRELGWWVLSGGGIEKNETLEQALSREVREETNLEVLSAEKYGEFLSDGSRNPNGQRNLTLSFLVEASGEPVALNEIVEVKWFSADKALKLERLSQSAEFFIKKLVEETVLK